MTDITDRNLASYTPPNGVYPEYLSINFRNTMVEITVRSAEQEVWVCGSTATIRMNVWNFMKVLKDAEKNLR